MLLGHVHVDTLATGLTSPTEKRVGRVQVEFLLDILAPNWRHLLIRMAAGHA